MVYVLGLTRNLYMYSLVKNDVGELISIIHIPNFLELISTLCFKILITFIIICVHISVLNDTGNVLNFMIFFPDSKSPDILLPLNK